MGTLKNEILTFNIKTNFKTTKTSKGYSIMNMSLIDLKQFCINCLSRFDDYQQDCTDLDNKELEDYFVDSYNSIDKIVHSLNESNLNYKLRNEIRMIVKETEKMAIGQNLISVKN